MKSQVYKTTVLWAHIAWHDQDIDCPQMVSNWDIWDGDKWIHSEVRVAALGLDIAPQEDNRAW